MDTNKIAKRVAQAHLQKQAGSWEMFFELVDKKKWRGIMDALRKAGDQASLDMWVKASEEISDQLRMDRNTEMALNKMRNLMVKSNWNDPKALALLRNQVFKIADLLGIKLPHAMFASQDKEAARKFKKGDFVYIKSTNAIAQVLDAFDARGTQEVRTDADGMRDADDLEPLKSKHFKSGVNFAPDTLEAMGGKLKFAKALVAELKEAKHRVGLPPYGSWKKFVDITQLRMRQDYHADKADEDLKHALSELRGYASYGGEHARDMKTAYGAVIDAQNTVAAMKKLQAKFDKDMGAIHAALKKVNQIV